MINSQDEDQPIVERLRKALDDLDSIKNTLDDMIGYTNQDNQIEFQLERVKRVRSFIKNELHRREILLLERFKSVFEASPEREKSV